MTSLPQTGQPRLTVAVCSYNSAPYLAELLPALAGLACPVPFEILVVDNNSTDHTRQLVTELQSRLEIPLRYVLERNQGIPHARNRAIEACMERDFMAFIDADELPDPLWLSGACEGLIDQGADCVGGRIDLDLPTRPRWLSDSLLPFLGYLDHGDRPFRVVDRTTPVWSGNVAYRMQLFRNGGIRFDHRYNRAGSGIGGGSDGILFRVLLKRGIPIQYQPRMRIVHRIPAEKLRRSYFLRLHYTSGRKAGLFEAVPEGRTLLGAPRYMYPQLLRKTRDALLQFIRRDPEYLRTLMNAAHLLGTMRGLNLRAQCPDEASSCR